MNDRERPVKGEYGFIPGLTLVGLGLFFYRLGAPGLMDPDEGRYAEIAREMLVLRDWLVPHLNFVPYLEKPPLVYWLTAVSLGLFGGSEWAARLPVALSALAGAFLAYGLGRAMWGSRQGWVSALVLATCGGYVVLGRLLTLDMPLTLFMNLGVGLGYLALTQGRNRLWPWAYLALALGVLTKGPVALVLPVLIWGLWLLLSRRPLWGWISLKGMLLLAGLCLPWFLGVGRRYPEFLRFFLWEQHLGRFLTPAVHPEPFYFYLPVLLGLLLPWCWLLPWALGRERPQADPHRLFLLIWAGVILLFFSSSRGKLAPYILPALLPLALLVGQSLSTVIFSPLRLKENRGLALSLWLWASTAGVLLFLYLWPPAALAPVHARIVFLSPFLPLCLAVLALTPLAALALGRPGILLPGAVLLSLLLPGAMERISRERSPRELARKLQAHWVPGSALVGVQLYSQGLSYYLGQPFYLMDFRTELDFGHRLDPHSRYFFASPQEMARFAAAQPRVFFFLKQEGRGLLEQEVPGRFHFLGRHKNSILLSYENIKGLGIRD